MIVEQILFDRLREVSPSLDQPIGQTASKEAAGSRFSEIVSSLISEVNEKQNVAQDNAVGLAKGEVDIMDTVVALNEADLSLRMMMQIRDRALDAYQQILRTI